MSTAGITDVIQTLFNAPLDAACKAEANYRKIWTDWIQMQKAIFMSNKKNVKDNKLTDEAIKQLFDIAPVISFTGVLDIALTMRIAEVKKKEGEISAGIQVGPVHAGGKFSFMSQKSEESLFQAATTFTMSNVQTDLKEYLKEHGLEPAAAGDLEAAIKLLEGHTSPEA